jgi:hypothetical protein
VRRRSPSGGRAGRCGTAVGACTGPVLARRAVPAAPPVPIERSPSTERRATSMAAASGLKSASILSFPLTPGSPSDMLAARQMHKFAFDFRLGRPVVGLPVRLLLATGSPPRCSTGVAHGYCSRTLPAKPAPTPTPDEPHHSPGREPPPTGIVPKRSRKTRDRHAVRDTSHLGPARDLCRESHRAEVPARLRQPARHPSQQSTGLRQCGSSDGGEPASSGECGRPFPWRRFASLSCRTRPHG